MKQDSIDQRRRVPFTKNADEIEYTPVSAAAVFLCFFGRLTQTST